MLVFLDKFRDGMKIVTATSMDRWHYIPTVSNNSSAGQLLGKESRNAEICRDSCMHNLLV